MSAETHKSALQQQLEELARVGVGGKYSNKEDQLKVIQDELEHEEAMLRGGMERYHIEVKNAAEILLNSIIPGYPCTEEKFSSCSYHGPHPLRKVSTV